MAIETPWGDWLARVRQVGNDLRHSQLPIAERAPQFLEAICDGERLCAALVWEADRDGKFRAATAGGIARIAGAEGKLNLDLAIHLPPIKTVLSHEAVPPALWTTAQGKSFLRVIRRVVLSSPAQLAIELFLPAHLAPDTAGVDLAADEVVAVLVRMLSAPSDSPAGNSLNDDFWRQLDQFSLSLQRSLSTLDVAMVAVNDGRVMLDCDRVTLTMKSGHRTKVVASSGQESTQQRANLIYHLSQLANAVCELGESVIYTGSTAGFPASFQEPLAKYIEESRSRMVHLVPLRESLPHHQVELDLADQKRLPPGRVIACLVIEQSRASDPLTTVSQRLPLIADQIAAALSNARQQDSIFLLPLWKTIGRTLAWFRGRRLAIALGILAAVGAVIAALAVVPWEYRLEAVGRAMPTRQHDLFAPWDGDVMQVLVENGQTVEQGELVLVLRSDDLETERLTAENAVHERQKHLASLTHQRESAAATGETAEVGRLETEIATTEVERDGARLQVEMFRQRLAALQVRSPVAGVVATFQVSQNLLDRPVKRGDRLLEVMDIHGPWRLELDAPEYRMGHLHQAVIARSTSSPSALPTPDAHATLLPTQQLDVDYIVATAVTKTQHGKLSEIGTRTNESQKAGSTVVELHVDIDPHDLPGRHIGAEVTAKIHCGPMSLGYVLFGDVWEFLIRKVWW